MTDFSILLPVYNVEEYLDECIKSILNQTHQNYEIICVEDYSSDSSKEILNKYSNLPNIKIIFNKENKGLGSARNTALSYATGKYIVCIDSDDYIQKTYLEKVYSAFKETDANSVWFDAKTTDNKKKITSSYNKSLNKGQNIINNNELFYYANFAWNKVYKLENIKEINARWSEGKLFEDIFFFYNYFSKYSDVYYINEPLYTYRKRPLLTSITDKCFEGSEHFEDIFEAITDTFLYLKEQNRLNEEIKFSLIQEVIISLNTFIDTPQCYLRAITAAKKAFNIIN